MQPGYPIPLRQEHNELDYAAVTNSMAYRGGIDTEVKKLTKSRNLENIKRHEREFVDREAFVYTVLSSDEHACFGCVYINPPTRGDYDAEVLMWVTVQAYGRGFDEVLFKSVRNWIEQEWPFNRVAYPGRSIGWKEWDALEK